MILIKFEETPSKTSKLLNLNLKNRYAEESSRKVVYYPLELEPFIQLDSRRLEDSRKVVDVS